MTKDVRPPLPFESMAVRIGLRARLFFDVLIMCCQWQQPHIYSGLSVVDSIGTQLAVLYREVPLYAIECMCVVGEGGAIISF